MDEKLRFRITAFFDYWRERHNFIGRLDFKKNYYEANILIWASLDALSNLWEKNIERKQCKKKSKRLIFDAFLARYGGEIFQKVSLPDVWYRLDCIDCKRGKELPEDACNFLRQIGDRRTPDFVEKHKNRQISDDLRLDKIITATLENCREIDQAKLEEWLFLSRFGAIGYKVMRSAFIHEGKADKGTHSFDLIWSDSQPTYLTGIYTTPPIIGFKPQFMLGILLKCINEFETDAIALEQDPSPQNCQIEY